MISLEKPTTRSLRVAFATTATAAVIGACAGIASAQEELPPEVVVPVEQVTAGIVAAPAESGAENTVTTSQARASGGGDASDGGVAAPGMPQINYALCVRQCVSGFKATRGASVTVKGKFLDRVRTVVFRGTDGPVRARYRYRDAYRVRAIVPDGAVSSRPYVVAAGGLRSNRSKNTLEILPVTAIPREVFPVRGPHTYGDGLGAGRGHKGVDVMANCGLTMVSALAGRVAARGYDGYGGGNYVVINSIHHNWALVYMHLARPARVQVGQRVGAGQRIGIVGSTGNSTACHLHFEMWRGKWWGGGTVMDPLPYLKAWDRKS